MKFKKVIAFAAAAVLALGSAASRGFSAESAALDESVYFSNMDSSVNGGEPIRGVDISSIIAVENSGVVLYNEYGNPQDVFKTLADNGVNYIRVRVWNNPYDSEGNGYGGGNNDVYTAGLIGKRAADYGMKIMVDFQYSDFWCDPSRQTVPKAWSDYSHKWKMDAIYNFTKQSLQSIADAGADIGMVQIGNETDCFFCGETDMYKISELFSSGCAAVREFDSSIMTVLHFANPSTGYYDWYAKVLDECNVDYDVFSTSYYTYWHGSLSNLTSTLSKIGNTYDKYVMVAETAYPYTSEDGDYFGNMVSEDSEDTVLDYPLTVEGQIQNMTDVFQAIANVGEKGIGAFYWEPAWIGVSGAYFNENSVLWETYGSGWASSYAAEYDDEAAANYGGSLCDNQALFDFDGKPLDSLKVFSRIYPQSKEQPAAEGSELAEGMYRIKNINSGLYLTVANGSGEEGNAVVQYAADGAAEYNTWHLSADENGYYRLYSDIDGGETYLLSLSDGSAENQTDISISGVDSGDSQRFKLIENDDGTYYLATKTTNDRSVIEIADAYSDNGGKAQQYEVNRHDCQKWQLEPVEEYYKTCDLNEDGIVNVFDLMILKKRLRNGDVHISGDFNDDGEVSVSDAVTAQKYILGQSEINVRESGTPKNTIFPEV